MQQSDTHSDERFELLARAANAACWDWNLITDQVIWSGTVTTMFGYPRGEVSAASEWWKERVHPDDRARVLGEVEAVIANGDVFESEYRFRTGAGKYVYVFDRGTVVRDETGKSIRMFGAMTDISEHKEMQARLRLADRMASVGTLAAGVAHEINNPLTYVIANVGFAVTQLQRAASRARSMDLGEPISETLDLVPPLEETQQALQEALEGAERVRLIVRDLKLFSRPDDQSVGPVNVRRIIESSISMAQNEIRHRAQVVREFRDVPAVEGNDARLGQVFLNLLVNAAQSITEGAADRNQIFVSTRERSDGRIVIEIRDTGSGIPPENLERIFDPFFTTKRNSEGTGLGLAICHGIITGYGGSIEVDSEVGRGSTFRVILPASTQEVSMTPASIEAVPQGPKATILVIDDEPLVGKSVQRILRRDQKVVFVSSAEEALKRLTSGEHYDMILCDLMMPQMTGMELYERLQTVAPDLISRIVFISGGVFTPRSHEFLQRVPNRRLDKPLEAQPLRRLVQEIVHS
jgi:PAS domain S-box-containing protein